MGPANFSRPHEISITLLKLISRTLTSSITSLRMRSTNSLPYDAREKPIQLQNPYSVIYQYTLIQILFIDIRGLSTCKISPSRWPVNPIPFFVVDLFQQLFHFSSDHIYDEIQGSIFPVFKNFNAVNPEVHEAAFEVINSLIIC